MEEEKILKRGVPLQIQRMGPNSFHAKRGKKEVKNSVFNPGAVRQ